MRAMPWEAMPWDAGLAILGVYRILRARTGPRLGGSAAPGLPPQARRRSADDPSTARRSHVASRNPTKEHPKITIEFGTAFGSQNAPKSLPTRAQKPPKKSSKSQCSFRLSFCPILYRFVLLFAAARPTILLLFTALSWGAAFSRSWKSTNKQPRKKLPT